MNERVMQFRVGVVVVATLIIAGLLITLNSPLPLDWIPWLSGKYEIKIELQQAPGIGPSTPIRKNGLLIGRVSAVNDLDDRVEVIAKIDKGRKLYPQYRCQVTTTMLGDSTIEFVSAPLPPGAKPLASGAVVQGTVEPNPIDAFAHLEGDLASTIHSLGRAGDEVAKLAETVNRAFGDSKDTGRLAEITNKFEVAIDDFTVSMRSMNEFFGDREMRQRLKQGLDELPDAIHDARLTFQDAREAMDGLQSVVDSADRNLQNLEGLTEPLGRSGENVAESIMQSVDSLDRLIEEVTVLTRAINSREGTVGQLIHSREFYDNLNQLVINTNYVIGRVNEIVTWLRPVVADARVFMDKIAREPGRIVGGALNKGPGIK